MTKKVAIIGNGLVGTFAALSAAKGEDVDITLYERNGKERQGSSKTGYGEGSRCIRFRGEETVLTPLIKDSLKIYDALQQKNGANFLTPNRAAVIAPKDHKSLAKAEHSLRAHGLQRGEADGYTIEDSASLQNQSGLGIFKLPADYHAILEQSGTPDGTSVSATFSPSKLFEVTDKLLAQAPNVHIKPYAETSWEVIKDLRQGETSQDKGKIRVHTESGTQIVDELIIASGQDTAKHLAQAGLSIEPWFEPVHLKHFRLSGNVGESLNQDGRNLPFFMLSFPSTDNKPDTQTGEGYLWGLGQCDDDGKPLIKVGFSSAKVKQPSSEDALAPERSEALTDAAIIRDLHLRDDIKAEAIGTPVTCYYTMPPDGKKIPILGSLQLEGLAKGSHVAVFGLDAGVSGKLAPVAGAILADIALGRPIRREYEEALNTMSPYREGLSTQRTQINEGEINIVDKKTPNRQRVMQ